MKNNNYAVTIFFRQLFITIKRFLLKPAMLILAIIMIAFSLLLRTAEETSDTSAVIAYYIADATKYEDEADSIREKIEAYEGYFTFVEYGSAEEIERLVLQSKLQYGYVIPSDIFSLTSNGEKKNLIVSYINEDSSLSYIADELVYAIIFPGISESMLSQAHLTARFLTEDKVSKEFADYLFEESDIAEYLEENNISRKEVEETFMEYTKSSTFSIDYIPLSSLEEADELVIRKDSDIDEDDSPSFLTASVRGICALLINLAAVFGILDYYRVRNTYLRNHNRMALFSIAIPTIITSIVGFISIYISGSFTSIVGEISAMLIYCIILIAINFVLCKIIKGPVVFYSLLPFYILACMIFTPIFIDINRMMPSLRFLSYIFLPNYYLGIF